MNLISAWLYSVTNGEGKDRVLGLKIFLGVMIALMLLGIIGARTKCSKSIAGAITICCNCLWLWRKQGNVYHTRNTTTKHQRRGVLLPPQKGEIRQMNAIEWLRGKLHIEPDERKIGKKYYEKCDKDTATELEASYSTYMILKDRGYGL